nr:peroxisomal membrane protein 13-like [Tanacetum cinerariifolium]
VENSPVNYLCRVTPTWVDKLTSGDKSLDLSAFKLSHLFFSLLSSGSSSCWRLLRILKITHRVVVQAGTSSGQAPLKPSSPGSTSDVVEASRTTRRGKMVLENDTPVVNTDTLGRPAPSKPWM